MIVLLTMRMFAWLVLLSQAVFPEEWDAVGTDAFDRDDDAQMLDHTGWKIKAVLRNVHASRFAVLTLPALDLKSESACP